MSLVHACRRAALALALGLASLAAAAADEAASAPAAAASAPRELLVMLRAPTAHARIDGNYGGAGYGDAARAQSQARVGARLAAEHGLSVVTLWALPALGMDCVVLALPPAADLQASIAALQSHPEVAWAQPMNEFRAQGIEAEIYRYAGAGHVFAGRAHPNYNREAAELMWPRVYSFLSSHLAMPVSA